MLWVRIPPGPLEFFPLMEQSGVLAALSRRRPRVQIPLGGLYWHSTQTGKATKLKPWRTSVGSTPTCATAMPQAAMITGWASAQPWLITTAAQVRLLNPALLGPSTQTRQSDQVESLVFVGSTPTSVTHWSRGPAATTAGLHPGNDGSSPSGITDSAKPQAAKTDGVCVVVASMRPCEGRGGGFNSPCTPLGLIQGHRLTAGWRFPSPTVRVRILLSLLADVARSRKAPVS
jgi:hypothetical protein